MTVNLPGLYPEPITSMMLSKVMLKICLLCFLGMNLSIYGQKITPLHDSLPALPANKNRLFYLQRTIDRNAVIYELNYNDKGQIDEKKPVKVYWLNYTTGKTSALNFAQNEFAYGIQSELIDAEKKVFLLTIKAYKKTPLYLQPDKNNRYKVYAALNNKPSILTRIIVNITGGTYLKPIVSHIELIGIELKTGNKIVEKVLP